MDSCHSRPQSEYSLSSDELFQSFMDIAISHEEDKVEDDISFVPCSDVTVDLCQYNLANTKDPADGNNKSHVAANLDCHGQVGKDVELSNGDQQQTTVNGHKPENITNNLTVEECEDPSRSRPIKLEKEVSGENDSSSCDPNTTGRKENENDIVFDNGEEITITLKSDSEVEVDQRCLSESDFTEENPCQSNEQLQGMDITLDGIKFSWDPSSSGTVENSSHKQCNCNKDKKGLPDIVCSCNENDKQLAFSSKTFEEIDGSETGDTCEPNSGRVIKEMYYDSPRESIKYDSFNIRQCIDIIDQRNETSSEPSERTFVTKDNNSKFYCDVNLDFAELSTSLTTANISNSRLNNTHENLTDRNSNEMTDTSSQSQNSSIKSSDSDGNDDDDHNDHDVGQGINCKDSLGRESIKSTTSEREFREEYARNKPRSDSEVERNNVIYSGSLIKLGGSGLTPKNWRKRWFELKVDNCLYYYKSPKDKIPSGTIILANYLATRCVDVGKRYCFKLTKGGARTYCLAAESDDEMKRWMKVLSEASKSNWDKLSHIPECSVKNVSIPALSIKDPDCHGYVWKQGFTHKSWKRRYCVLKSGCLYYYGDMSEPVAIGMFKLHNYDIKETESTGRKWSIIAIPPDPRMRTFYFAAESELDFNRWYESLQTSIKEVRAASLPR